MSHLGSGVRFFSPFGPSFGLGTKAVLNPSACAAARSFWWAATIMISDGVRSSSSARSEEHTSELQSQSNLVCRLLLEKKKKNTSNKTPSNFNVTRDNASPVDLHIESYAHLHSSESRHSIDHDKVTGTHAMVASRISQHIL